MNKNNLSVNPCGTWPEHLGAHSRRTCFSFFIDHWSPPLPTPDRKPSHMSQYCVSWNETANTNIHIFSLLTSGFNMPTWLTLEDMQDFILHKPQPLSISESKCKHQINPSYILYQHVNFFPLERIWGPFSLTKGSRHEAFQSTPLMSGNAVDNLCLLTFFFSFRSMGSEVVSFYAHLRTFGFYTNGHWMHWSARHCKTSWSSTMGVALGPPPFHQPSPTFQLLRSLWVPPILGIRMHITRRGNQILEWGNCAWAACEYGAQIIERVCLEDWKNM